MQRPSRGCVKVGAKFGATFGEKTRAQVRGFTLVEVLVAVLVVSLALSALHFQMMSTVDNTGYLRDKTIAHWVAMNQLELLQLENESNNELLRESRSGSETMAGRTWYWRVKPLKTQAEGFQQLEISVGLEQAGDDSLVTVIGLIDSYHAT